ncbi:MAG: hypothetical protein LBJ00_08630 [Planctomycetaceae bacterium]|nr:hypothetical protein [Planctomycetaceae bacterium]
MVILYRVRCETVGFAIGQLLYVVMISRLVLGKLNLMYTVTGRVIGFALEQPLHVVELACSALGILKQLEYNNCNKNYGKKTHIQR